LKEIKLKLLILSILFLLILNNFAIAATLDTGRYQVTPYNDERNNHCHSSILMANGKILVSYFNGTHHSWSQSDTSKIESIIGTIHDDGTITWVQGTRITNGSAGHW